MLIYLFDLVVLALINRMFKFDPLSFVVLVTSNTNLKNTRNYHFLINGKNIRVRINNSNNKFEFLL